MLKEILYWQWALVIGLGLLMWFLAPRARELTAFFSATQKDGQQPGFWMLASSLVISWIFAKSITNAANLGLSFGLVGGVAYAGYYLSFVVAGWVIYQLRTRGGFHSIHHFLQSRFGRGAVWVFSLLIAFRLFNEVWSNTMVIGSYFGAAGSGGYYAAVLVFTALTLAYTLKGGLSSSLLTDAIQMLLFGVLLAIILGVIIPRSGGQVSAFLGSGEWTLATGVNLLWVAVLQSLSYPFHDPVLTDRGFISPPKLTLKAYLWAAVVGAVCIMLFSFVGIFGQMEGLSGQAPVEVSKLLGVGIMLVMNVIMITSAASTLDSTFSSSAKLWVVDLGKSGEATVSKGRWAMAVVALLGTLPVFAGPEILSATTISGTMVIGLAPIFLGWWLKAPPLSFYLAVGAGVATGVVLAMGYWPDAWTWFPGKYGDLLSANLVGTGCCVFFYFIPYGWSIYGKRKNYPVAGRA
ncbi:MAG: sodium:solute symporter [Bacteroidota bacterium]